MRPRPRCCSWLPLSTQQLRLRNLIRIEGLNIKYNASAVICYTLHQSIEGDPFYLSEYLPLQQQLKWTEINCPVLFKSNDQSVCVKVWARLSKGKSATEKLTKSCRASEIEPFSALKDVLPTQAKAHFKNSSSLDQMLFIWGVYFSGLIPISQCGDIKFNYNSLLFYINGDCFTSAEHIMCKYISRNDLIKSEQLNVPQEKEYMLHHLHTSKYLSEIKCSDTRYNKLCFKSSDVRRSYNLAQLLKLQELQRRQLQKIKESKDFTNQIKRQSMYCITKDQLCSPHTILLSSSFSRNQQRYTMGRALSELFSEQQQISPQSLLYAQKLRKKLETLQLKQRLLQSEYKTYSERISQHRARLNSLKDICQQAQSSLASRHQQLLIEKKLLGSQYQEQSILLQKKQKIIWDMERRMSALCVGLREIYPIEQNSNGLNTINNVPFPGMNPFANVAKLAIGIKGTDDIFPMTLSVSLGYIAHLVQMIALIINRPLRNAVIHQGSRSRIVDTVKEIPHSCSEFPLYSRSTIPSKSVKYAILLLNQNIAQLCYDIAGIRCDMRLTLENIHHIFIYLGDIQNLDEKKHINSHIYHHKRLALNYGDNKNVGNGCENVGNNLLSKSHSSVDINHISVPLTMTIPENSLLQLRSSIPLSIEGAFMNKQRISRSVGSYSDSEDDFKDMHGHGYSNSDSVIVMSPNHI